MRRNLQHKECKKNSTGRNLQEEINKVEYQRRNDKHGCVHMG